METPNKLIARNKKARFDYFIEDELEAGLVLEGWEVKSLRAARVQLKESHIGVHQGELFLLGATISPLPTTQHEVDRRRARKLLLQRQQIHRLIGQVERRGYTLVALSLYWLRGRVKAKIALAKGKKLYDKRAAIKQREWQRQQQRLLKSS